MPINIKVTAGIIILIDISGGLIGHSAGVDLVLCSYTLLQLVALVSIPALLISTSAGIIVTKPHRIPTPK